MGPVEYAQVAFLVGVVIVGIGGFIWAFLKKDD